MSKLGRCSIVVGHCGFADETLQITESRHKL